MHTSLYHTLNGTATLGARACGALHVVPARWTQAAACAHPSSDEARTHDEAEPDGTVERRVDCEAQRERTEREDAHRHLSYSTSWCTPVRSLAESTAAPSRGPERESDLPTG